MASEVGLAAWNAEMGSWSKIADWAGVLGGRWVDLVVPLLCSNEMDCSNNGKAIGLREVPYTCLLYTSPSPRDQRGSRMPSSA